MCTRPRAGSSGCPHTGRGRRPATLASFHAHYSAAWLSDCCGLKLLETLPKRTWDISGSLTEEWDLDKVSDVLGTKSQSLSQFRERKMQLNHASYHRRI